jgi:hypothetical protein
MFQGINSKKENVASILEFDIGCKHHIAHVLEKDGETARRDLKMFPKMCTRGLLYLT